MSNCNSSPLCTISPMSLPPTNTPTHAHTKPPHSQILTHSLTHTRTAVQWFLSRAAPCMTDHQRLPLILSTSTIYPMYPPFFLSSQLYALTGILLPHPAFCTSILYTYTHMHTHTHARTQTPQRNTRAHNRTATLIFKLSQTFTLLAFSLGLPCSYKSTKYLTHALRL